MYYLKRDDLVIDQIADANVISERLPYHKETFDTAKHLREAYEDLATYTNWGRQVGGKGFKRLATIPHGVAAGMIALEPDIFIDKKKFYGWLKKHPEYGCYRRR